MIYCLSQLGCWNEKPITAAAVIKYSYATVFTQNYSALIPRCDLHNYCFIIVNDVIGDERCEIQLSLTNDAGTTPQHPINFSKLILFLLLTSQMFVF